jgi:tetratricopeptide (TPR) repeat protein
MPDQPSLDRRFIPTGLGIALLTFAAYSPLARNGFISFDDPQYILENSHINSGFTWSGVAWAFTSGYASNWHPLTWLSHMLDCSLFGVHPAGHHLMTLLQHTGVSMLLCVMLFRLTGAFWRSALVAALFAIHPLHVESVAWASERKDVLSALFFLLTLAAYSSYARGRAPKVEGRAVEDEDRRAKGEGSGRAAEASGHSTRDARHSTLFYFLALALFALGLMSKPMLVTTPFVLLLLDLWPLQRFAVAPTAANTKLSPSPFVSLLAEKIPFLVLAIAASVVTFVVQRADGAVASLEHRPLSLRLGNALVSYVRYLGKTFWPTDLALIYPYPKAWSILAVIASASLLLAVSVFVCLRLKKNPYLFAGWFWFVGMLVPTIGLVQVGRQAMADRYMYLPSIGLFILLVWGAHDLLLWLESSAATRTRLGRAFAASGSILLLGLCIPSTFCQAGYWRSGETIFRHALAVTKDNGPALDGLGAALIAAGRPAEALPLFEDAVRLDPSSADAHFNLGTVLMQSGRASEAIPHLELVVSTFPQNVKARINLGCALFNLGKLAEAESQFETAAKVDPSNPQSHYALGTVLLAQSKLEAATAELSTAVNLNPKYVSEAVKLNPNAPLLRYNLGTILLMQSHVADALEQLSAAVQLDPNFREAHRNLAIAFMQQGRQSDGIAHFREALRLNPNDADLHGDLGVALLEQNQPEQALAQFREGLKLKPQDLKLQQRLSEAQARLASK